MEFSSEEINLPIADHNTENIEPAAISTEQDQRQETSAATPLSDGELEMPLETPEASTPPTSPLTSADHPFVIELLQQDVQANGNFRPDARVVIRPALRTSGLLQHLAAEEMRSLLLLLTFVTSNGDIAPSLREIAHVMHCNHHQARSRMERLTREHFKGQPIAFSLKREMGQEAYALSPHLITVTHLPVQEPTFLPSRVASRATIIANSRARYTKPRAEVEALIAKQMGWEMTTPPDDPEERTLWELRQSLSLLGANKDEIETLLAQHPIPHIQEQIAWLPYRKANNPLRYLIAALEGHYEMPPVLRRQHFSPINSQLSEDSHDTPSETAETA